MARAASRTSAMVSYPNKPGHRGIDTSIAAAEAFAPHLAYCQHVVHQVVEEAGAYGAIGDEIAEKLGWDRYAVRPRTSELKKKGLIVDSGRRRPGRSGRLTTVWVVPRHSI